MHGRDYFYDRDFFGFDFMNSGWHYLIMAVITIAVIVLIVYLLNSRQKHITVSPALESLKLKYVHGEITEDEYLAKKATILKGR
ncbi:MAG: SHOCT domain-containing protein [Vallitaleaceae bacterium]|jgi:uncharacterized membrane protein|nr:SHOCT domain-containing protein [Vallitaleaceae bacterium]